MEKTKQIMKDFLKKISVVLLATFLFYIGANYNPSLAQTPSQLYDRAWKLINAKYVDQTNNEQDWDRWRHKYDKYLKTEEDAYVAIETMVASLNDVYTKFLNPKEFKEETESIQGSLKGIGVQIGTRDGKLLIIAPIEDTPGEKAGLLAEDEILEINGESTKGITVDKAAEKIRGEEGTEVTLLIKRKNVPNKTYTIKRAKIEIKSVSTKLPEYAKIDEQIGYIRLSSFISKNATQEFEKALLDNQDKKGIIIDLRSNPGGLLTNAIFIADMLLDSKIIVSTVDRDGYKETQKATPNVLTNQPIVVLIDGGSASASEILSGALKDNKRATIVGKKSFGKGLVQEINRMPNGSAMHITIQKYLTPNGTDINKKGIEPDIVVDITKEDIEAKRDPQIQKANEVLLEMIK
ncbi:MAG: S41 family peptidase [Cyanobacteria bacterium SIG30]|nr:S41 family peptidase [Cyanobacteria bacterium SIG30]